MKYYSQAGQDAFVIDWLGTEPGYFVDIGAHDGVVHSNTYALERAGWTGVCVEPDPGPFIELNQNRSCLTSGVAISDHDGDVIIRPAGQSVPCRTLVNLLTIVNAPPVIDFLSIDVEGHELEVLAGMDFDRRHVRLITIEHNLYCDGPSRKEAIFDALTGHGFKRVREDVVADGYGPYEDWYQSSFEREMRVARVLDAAPWPSPS